tara:strand:- start:18680 stop:19483 length:804 start_codon:yes stop_codon:yes gene_type:complete
MANLVDILNNVAKRNGLDRVDTFVIETLHGLSEGIDFEMEEGESRLIAYQEGLSNFVSGLEEGYEHIDLEMGDIHSPYEVGHGVGYGLKNRITEGEEWQRDIQVTSYQDLYEQLRHVADLIGTELKELQQAVQEPYDFMLTRLPQGAGMDKQIGESLATILSSYQDLTRGLLDETLDESSIRELEGKEEPTFDELMQPGIVYLVRGNLNTATTQLQKAKNMDSDHNLRSPLIDVAGNILAAHRSFQSIYSTIKLAQDLEKAPQYAQP